MKRLLLKTKYLGWSIENWLRGFQFGPIKRCRICGHTAYKPEHPTH